MSKDNNVRLHIEYKIPGYRPIHKQLFYSLYARKLIRYKHSKITIIKV